MLGTKALERPVLWFKNEPMEFPVYRITYANGITQKKHLITHEEYLTIIKPNRKIVDTFKSEKELKVKTIKTQDYKTAEWQLSKYPENWFTDKSPIFDAIATGILSLGPTQGGDHKVIMQEIV